MGCCGKNSDDGRSDNVEMKGGKGGKNGGGGKWGEFSKPPIVAYTIIFSTFLMIQSCIEHFHMKLKYATKLTW